MAQQGDSIILEEEIDPNYNPTEDEVVEYAKWLGMDVQEDRDLLWIAREGLKVRRRRLRDSREALMVSFAVLHQAPLPENWKPCKTVDTGEIYYFNFATGDSTWDHPCDDVRGPGRGSRSIVHNS